MKPFSFSENLERPRSKCLRRSMSSPNLPVSVDKSENLKNFKAKPCPKNLFSNYVSHKLWEDDYFR